MALPPSDLMTLLQDMENRDQQRREEEQLLRKEEAAARQQEFAALIAALSQRPSVTSAPSATSDTSEAASPQPPLPPHPPHTQIKAVISRPPPLQPDATYQAFREWRRRWQDYAVVVVVKGY